ncbi:hypothetical protein KJ570_03700 [Patescibacteria group bacterium]|nr:hypothetical protein [Patescibacteria group bacterium]MBU2036394.1 hypothetical protein [Patescibacteria group bacterium]
MANLERQAGSYDSNVLETIALFLLDKIKKEDMDDNNRFVLGYYLSLMDEDQKFRDAVNSRKNVIIMNMRNGRKIPLYTDDELKKAKRHKKHKKHKEEVCFQPKLIREESSVLTTKTHAYQSVIDPEKNLARLHREFEKLSYGYNKNSLVKKDIAYNKKKFKDAIGLPIAKGKNPHVNDSYYQFLVRKIVESDVFGIVGIINDNDEATDLDRKISQVKGFISEVLNDDNIKLREKYSKYKEFVNKYNEKWKINLT